MLLSPALPVCANANDIREGVCWCTRRRFQEIPGRAGPATGDSPNREEKFRTGCKCFRNSYLWFDRTNGWWRPQLDYCIVRQGPSSEQRCRSASVFAALLHPVAVCLLVLKLLLVGLLLLLSSCTWVVHISIHTVHAAVSEVMHSVSISNFIYISELNRTHCAVGLPCDVNINLGHFFLTLYWLKWSENLFLFVNWGGKFWRTTLLTLQ